MKQYEEEEYQSFSLATNMTKCLKLQFYRKGSPIISTLQKKIGKNKKYILGKLNILKSIHKTLESELGETFNSLNKNFYTLAIISKRIFILGDMKIF